MHFYYLIYAMQGVIKKKMDKGYGFISSPELEKDLFFHKNSLVGVEFDQLQEGEAVTFEVDKQSAKGPAAINVQRAEAEAMAA